MIPGRASRVFVSRRVNDPPSIVMNSTSVRMKNRLEVTLTSPPRRDSMIPPSAPRSNDEPIWSISDWSTPRSLSQDVRSSIRALNSSSYVGSSAPKRAAETTMLRASARSPA